MGSRLCAKVTPKDLVHGGVAVCKKSEMVTESPIFSNCDGVLVSGPCAVAGWLAEMSHVRHESQAPARWLLVLAPDSGPFSTPSESLHVSLLVFNQVHVEA